MTNYTEIEIETDRLYFPEQDDLIRYIYTHTGRFIPNRAMCPGHDAPAELIEHILYGEGDVCAIANRSGGKTMQLGTACGMLGYPFLNRPKGVKTRELGGSGDQSKRVYEEFVSFLDCGYQDRVLGDVLMAKTIFDGGGRIELLTQSTRSVRGPHVPRLLMDEVDEFDRPVYQAALSIPQTQEGVTSMIAMASTRHRAYGLMRDVFDNFWGKKLIWCIFEVLEQCTDDYKCSTCNLASYCPGKEKMSDARGYLSIEDARKQRARIKDDEIYEAEALCLKPRTEGAVYPMLDKPLHFVPVSFNPSEHLFRSFDYGTDHPTVLGYWQIVKTEGRMQARQVDELRWRGKAPSTMVKDMIKHEKKQGYGSIKLTFVPHDAAGFRAELEDNDIGTMMPNQSVDDGIATIRNLLTPDENGTVGIVWNRETCEETWAELEQYHMKNGRVVKDKDDGPDQTRYFCHSMPELQTMCKPVIAMADFSMID